jgi:hypothetical protein
MQYSEYMQYMVYNCVYYFDTCYIPVEVLRGVQLGSRTMTYGMWHMAYGIRAYMAYGIWHMAYGIWHMVYVHTTSSTVHQCIGKWHRSEHRGD